jgi:hypothetical protein
MKRGSCNYVVSPLRHTDLESVTNHQGTSPGRCHTCIEPLYPPLRTTPLPRQAVHQPRKCFSGRSRWARARKIPLPPACLTARNTLGPRSIVCCAGTMQSSYRSSFRTTQSRRTEPMTRDSGCKNCHRAGLAGGLGCCRCGGNDEPKQTSPQLWFQDRASRLAHPQHQLLHGPGTVLGGFRSTNELGSTYFLVLYSFHTVATYSTKFIQSSRSGATYQTHSLI